MWDLLLLQIFQAVAEIGGDRLSRRLHGQSVWLKAACVLLWLVVALVISVALFFLGAAAVAVIQGLLKALSG